MDRLRTDRPDEEDLTAPVGRGADDRTPADGRAALERGELETCLEACRLGLESAAAGPDAKERAVEWEALRREALADLRRRCEGLGGSGAARWLGLLVRFDPSAADSVHLAWRAPKTPDRGGDGAATGTSSVGSVGLTEQESPATPTLVGTGERFRLAVDEAGEFLGVAATELRLGLGTGNDASGGDGGRGARLWRVPALRGGYSWRLDSGGSGATIDGAPIESGGATLLGGERLTLPVGSTGAPERYLFRRGADGASVRLDFEGGSAGDGLTGLVLLGRGREGRLRIGSRRRCLLRTPALDASLELWIEPVGLRLRGSGPLTLRRSRPDRVGAAATRQPADQREFEAGTVIEFPWPLDERVDVVAPASEHGRPPFWMRIEPESRAGRATD